MAGKVRIAARRGDVENAPENTLPAFESAISRGADTVEFDVHLTADGQLIVHHFYNLGSTDNGTGLVGEKTLSELKALDSGAWFSPQFSGITKPTFSEVLDLCRGRIGLEIDLKDASPAFLQKVMGEIDEFGQTDDIELTTAHIPLLACIKGINPKIRTGTFFLKPASWMPVRLPQRHALEWALALKIDVLHLHCALITPDFVRELHRHGFTVHGSNLDAAEEISQGIQGGIDAFSTGRLGTALSLKNLY